MILKKFLQPLLTIMGERSGHIQLIAEQFLMAAGGSKGLKMLFAPGAIFTHEQMHPHQHALIKGSDRSIDSEIN